MDLLTFAGLALALWVGYHIYKGYKEAAEKERRGIAVQRAHVASLAVEAQKQIDKVYSLKTTDRKIAAAEKAMEYLEEAGQYDEVRNVMENYDAVVDSIEIIPTVLPVVALIEKAQKHRFMDKEKLELDALKEALYLIRTKDISSNDFKTANIKPEGDNNHITVASIERRCKELGWSP